MGNRTRLRQTINWKKRENFKKRFMILMQSFSKFPIFAFLLTFILTYHLARYIIGHAVGNSLRVTYKGSFETLFPIVEATKYFN